MRGRKIHKGNGKMVLEKNQCKDKGRCKKDCGKSFSQGRRVKEDG